MNLRSKLALAASSVLILSLGSCGTINAPAPTSYSGNCRTIMRTTEAKESCQTWTGSLSEKIPYDMAENNCIALGGSTQMMSAWSGGTGYCDVTDVVGVCTVDSQLSNGGSFTSINYYYSTAVNNNTNSSAKTSCDDLRKTYSGPGDTVTFADR